MKVLLIITEIFSGSASTMFSSTMDLNNLGAGILISSSTALLTKIAILIKNEYISNLKIRYTKSKNWVKVITFLYEKTLKQSMVDKKIDQRQAEEMKNL